MKSFWRLGLIAFSCASVTSCGLGGFMIGFGHWQPNPEVSQEARCGVFRFAVTEPREAAIPTDEGRVETFKPAFWGFKFEGEREEQVERREYARPAGTLVITDRSVLLVSSSGSAGVRIPFEVVLDVDIEKSFLGREPRAVTVKSLCRLDIFTITQRQDLHQPDPEATGEAAAQLKARVAAFQGAHKETEPTR